MGVFNFCSSSCCSRRTPRMKGVRSRTPLSLVGVRPRGRTRTGVGVSCSPVVSDGTCEAACACRITRVRHSSANSEVVSCTGCWDAQVAALGLLLVHAAGFGGMEQLFFAFFGCSIRILMRNPCVLYFKCLGRCGFHLNGILNDVDGASLNENRTKKIRHGKARPWRETTEDRGGRGLVRSAPTTGWLLRAGRR